MIAKENPRAGFTLIELSIVLVIIGLLVGGVLVGRDLIHAAHMRSVATDYEKLVTATHTFKGKYNCIPGDCKRATTFFPDAINGDGDGKINSCWWGGRTADVNGGKDTTESFQYFYQLAAAQLIRGAYTGAAGPAGYRNYIPGINIMATNFNPTIGYTAATYAAIANPYGEDFTPGIMQNYYGTAIFIGAVQPYSDGWPDGACCETYSAAFTPAEGYYIDHKIDDGLPGSGKMIVWAPVTQQVFSGDNCTTTLDPATAKYDLSRSTLSCGFLVKAGF